MQTKQEKVIEEEILKEISPEEMLQTVEFLSERIGGPRLPGTPKEYNAAVYVKNRFESYGVPAEIEELDCYVDRSVESQLRILSPEMKDVICESFGWSFSTQPGGVTSDVVGLDYGTLEEYRRVDVAGKIILCRSGKIRRGEKAKHAEEHGAAGLIMIAPFPGNIISQLGTIGKLRHIPAVTVSYEDGQYLRQLLEKGSVTARLKVTSIREWAKTYNVTATLVGLKRPDEEISVGAHLDNWGPGAYDGGSQLAGVLELARIFSKFREKIGRTIIFEGWGGHEHGMYGSTHRVFDKEPAHVQRHLVFHMTLGPTFGWKDFKVDENTELRTNTSPEIQDFLREIVNEQGLGKTWATDYPTFTGADHVLYFLAGITSMHARGWFLSTKTPIWHATALDTFRSLRVDQKALEDTKKLMKLWGTIILRIANSEALPYNYVRWGERLRTEFETYSCTAVDFSRIIQESKELEKLAGELNAQISKIAALSQSPKQEKRVREIYDKVNKALIQPSRMIIPCIHNVDSYRRGEWVQPWPEKVQTLPITALPKMCEEIANLKMETKAFTEAKEHLETETDRLARTLKKAGGVLNQITKEVISLAGIQET